MNKDELLNLGIQEVIEKYEKEWCRSLSNQEKLTFLEGFNYACLLLSKEQCSCMDKPKI